MQGLIELLHRHMLEQNYFCEQSYICTEAVSEEKKQCLCIAKKMSFDREFKRTDLINGENPVLFDFSVIFELDPTLPFSYAEDDIENKKYNSASIDCLNGLNELDKLEDSEDYMEDKRIDFELLQSDTSSLEELIFTVCKH